MKKYQVIYADPPGHTGCGVKRAVGVPQKAIIQP